MLKVNHWVWSKRAAEVLPDSVEGESVPIDCLIEGLTGYQPRQSWIEDGYVKRIELKEYATELL